MSTIFTKIINNEIPSYKVYEDEVVCAFLDINPMQKGHTLVIPKVETDYLFDLDEKYFDRFMHRVRYVAQVLKAKTNCARVCVVVEGYAVPHAPVHLIPPHIPDDFAQKHLYVASLDELEI